MRAAAIAAAGLLVALAGCGPVPLREAEDQCVRQARLARGPSGEIGVGIGPGGAAATAEVTISADYLRGRDPEEVYIACVVQKAGELPSRPLAAHPDWPRR